MALSKSVRPTTGTEAQYWMSGRPHTGMPSGAPIRARAAISVQAVVDGQLMGPPGPYPCRHVVGITGMVDS